MAGKVREWLQDKQKIALCVARNWWRPVAQWGLAASVFVNCIYLPLHKGESISLVDLAALVTSFAPIIMVRAWEKQKEGGT